MVEHKCPECGGAKIVCDCDTGETVCAYCGLVLDDPAIDTRPEWRAFTVEEVTERSRVGMPASYSMSDKGLSTMMMKVEEDAFGKRLPQSTFVQMLRLKKWQKLATRPSESRNLALALTEIDRLCDRLQIPQPMKERAAIICRKALKAGVVKGRTIVAVACAAIYAACRERGVLRTVREIADASFVEAKTIIRCYRAILKDLDLKMPVPNLAAYVSKIAEPLNVGGDVQRLAVKILQMARENHETHGKVPMSLAAAALYIACRKMGVTVSQKRIADAAGVAEVTVRNRCNSLLRCLELHFFSTRDFKA